MSRRKTTEQFIEEAKRIHGDRYGYEIVSYKSADNRVKIICDIHGEFEQLPNNHLHGRGCNKCGRLSTGNKKRKTLNQFIEKSNKIHNNKYDYTLVEYINNSTKVKITCKEHGTWYQSPAHHLKGKGCPICAGKNKTTSIIIEEFKKIHGDKYDYSLVKYNGAVNNVIIVCKKHGLFEQTPSKHLVGAGCNQCGIEKVSSIKTLNTEQFIEKAKKVHGNRYDYSNVKYLKRNKKVSINCNVHGQFNQTPNNHLKGQGCYKCGIDSLKISSKDNPSGWNITNWNNTAKISKQFDSFKVYVLRCCNDKEVFYKIGRTFRKTKHRFKGNKSMPYKYEILNEIIFNNAKDAFNNEAELKRLNQEIKYVPLIQFNGMYECFSEYPALE